MEVLSGVGQARGQIGAWRRSGEPSRLPRRPGGRKGIVGLVYGDPGRLGRLPAATGAVGALAGAPVAFSRPATGLGGAGRFRGGFLTGWGDRSARRLGQRMARTAASHRDLGGGIQELSEGLLPRHGGRLSGWAEPDRLIRERRQASCQSLSRVVPLSCEGNMGQFSGMRRPSNGIPACESERSVWPRSSGGYLSFSLPMTCATVLRMESASFVRPAPVRRSAKRLPTVT